MNAERLILFIVFLLASFLNTNAEPYWHKYKCPDGSSYTLRLVEVPNNGLFFFNSNCLFRSTDNGENWQSIYESKSSMSSLVCNDNGIMFATNLRLNYKPNGYDYYTQELVKSTDYGYSWEKVTNPLFQDCWSYVIATIGTKVYHLFHKNSDNSFQLVSSDDDGNTWSYVNTLNVGSMFGFYVSNGYLCCEDGGTGSKKILISPDCGKNWRTIRFGEQYHNQIHIKSDNEYYLAAGGNDSLPGGIYHTIDSGKTWELKWFEGYRMSEMYFSKDYKYIFAVPYYIRTDFKDRIPFFSSDSGNSWQEIIIENFDDINPSSGINSFIEDHDGYLYANLGGYGICRSSNHGLNWVEMNKGYSGISGTAIAFSPTGEMYFTESGYGLYSFNTNTEKFSSKGLKKYCLGMNGDGKLLLNSKNDIFVKDAAVGNTYQGIFRSTDGGTSWKSLFSGTCITFMINKKDYIYTSFGVGGTQISKDNGDTWEDLQGICANRMAVNDEGHLFLFYNGTIYRSTDDGVTFDTLYKAIPAPGYTERNEVVVFNNKTKTAFYGYIEFYEENPEEGPSILWWGYLKTTDNGRTWFKDSTDLHITNFLVDSSYCWVAYTKFGLYRSCDNGKNWTVMDTTGLTSSQHFNSLAVSPDGYIYGFSIGGLYTNKPVTSVEEEPDNPSDETILLTNPVYDELTFKPDYFTTERIQIYSILGQKVLDENFSNKIDVRKFPSGIYFLKIGNKTYKFVKI